MDKNLLCGLSVIREILCMGELYEMFELFPIKIVNISQKVIYSLVPTYISE